MTTELRPLAVMHLDYLAKSHGVITAVGLDGYAIISHSEDGLLKDIEQLRKFYEIEMTTTAEGWDAKILSINYNGFEAREKGVYVAVTKDYTAMGRFDKLLAEQQHPYSFVYDFKQAKQVLGSKIMSGQDISQKRSGPEL